MEHTALRITDTTLRDGHQSLLATRLRTEHLLPLVERLDGLGLWSLEVWGGATFDAAHRFLAEDPWERLTQIKARARRTPLQMLLRGQNLVGYRNYADDVVQAFIAEAAAAGIDVFRVFDALNDERNFETCFAAIARAGKHIQATVCYSLTQARMGGPIFDLDYYLDKARRLEAMGAHSLCVKDMAGILAPADAGTLIAALKQTVRLPLQLHTHYTSGMGAMTYLKAVEAGVDVIDCSLAPLGLRTGQPAVEPFVVALRGTERDTGLDLSALTALGEELERLLAPYKALLETPTIAPIDTRVLTHQIPGGMASNLIAQLREADALERLPEVYAELPRVRADMGYPPLVTPTSQIVGTQAVHNVLFGRYGMVSSQVKDYFYGLYGRPPRPVDPAVRAQVLAGYERGQALFDGRPGDVLAPELPAARAAIQHITTEPRDVLTYALYPTSGLRFLTWKHGLEEVPAEVTNAFRAAAPAARPDAPAGTPPTATAAQPPPAPETPPPLRPTTPGAQGAALRPLRVHVAGTSYDVLIEDPRGGVWLDGRGGCGPTLVPLRAGSSAAVTDVSWGRATPPPAPAQPPAPGSTAPAVGHSAAAPPPPAPTPRAVPVAEADTGAALRAPMPGLVTRHLVQPGQQVAAGQPVLVLEAMKMETPLPAPTAGVVKALPYGPGAAVKKGDVLLIVG